MAFLKVYIQGLRWEGGRFFTEKWFPNSNLLPRSLGIFLVFFFNYLKSEKLTLLDNPTMYNTKYLKIAAIWSLFCPQWILTLHFARRRGFLSEILFPSLQKECLLWSQTQKIWETCNRIEFQKPRTYFFFFIVYQGLGLLLLQRYTKIMLHNLIWRKKINSPHDE